MRVVRQATAPHPNATAEHRTRNAELRSEQPPPAEGWPKAGVGRLRHSEFLVRYSAVQNMPTKYAKYPEKGPFRVFSRVSWWRKGGPGAPSHGLLLDVRPPNSCPRPEVAGHLFCAESWKHLPIILFMVFFTLVATAAEPAWNAFGGQENLRVRGVAGVVAGADVWFSVAKDHRRISSGTIKAEADGLKLPVRIPEMKPGVALALELTLRAGSEQGPVLRSGPLWAFAERPLEANHNPAAPRSILLYDPEGTTEPALRGIELPFETITKLDVLSDRTNAVIVVGEGVSLDGERGLWQTLMDAVAHGNHVLLLAPKDGQLHLPPAWENLMVGDAQKVLRHGTVAKLPYKLDLTNWPPDGKAAATRFQLAAFRDEAVFNVTPDAGTVAMGFDTATGGRFRACGLGIIAKWNETPAARWLLVEMLEEGCRL